MFFFSFKVITIFFPILNLFFKIPRAMPGTSGKYVIKHKELLTVKFWQLPKEVTLTCRVELQAERGLFIL